MLGIRIPILRTIAKEIKKTDYLTYLQISTPKTYEEIFLRGVIISYIKDYNIFLSYFKDYLKYIDNWCICDTYASKLNIIKKNKERFFNEIQLLSSNEEFTIRTGIVILMDYYLEPFYLKTIFSIFDNIKNDAYYIHMAIAWTISVMYIKYPKETLEYLKNNNLPASTQNKAIQKIRESKRVSSKEKDSLLIYKR